ncbi:MAG: CcdB family protein [Candidatus Andeanibacterium colombiense]|uniref:Toxin CcdB n=1 Tax=Candidatus Andeanibacterium colombiense TaxID=3121345 RepID=A0AAJ5X7X7_9SPHN|nr:MAG: CcdB family protein [Sphingomonadaceae bacterium]
MAQFDVYANSFGDGLLLDCQSDLLSHLNVRLVAPLLAPENAPAPAGRLNPLFEIGGEPYLMVTQYSGALEVRELGRKVASLAAHDREIMNALDFLLTGV